MKPVYCESKHVCTSTHTLTLTQTNFSSFACKSFQSPGMGSVHLCVAQQQVPIPFLSWSCGSGCAHPPSNLEVNPPQTSPGMPCWPRVCIWESPCVFLPIFSSMRFISANPDGIHTWLPRPLTTCRPNSAEYGLYKSLGIKGTLRLPSSWILRLESPCIE